MKLTSDDLTQLIAKSNTWGWLDSTEVEKLHGHISALESELVDLKSQLGPKPKEWNCLICGGIVRLDKTSKPGISLKINPTKHKPNNSNEERI
jgi:hypothetical protein